MSSRSAIFCMLGTTTRCFGGPARTGGPQLEKRHDMSARDDHAQPGPSPRASSGSELKAPLFLLLAGAAAICCLGLPLVAGLVYLCLKDPDVLVEMGEAK